TRIRVASVLISCAVQLGCGRGIDMGYACTAVIFNVTPPSDVYCLCLWPWGSYSSILALHNFRPDGLLYLRLMQAKEARAVCCIVAYTGVKAAPHPVDAQWIIEKLDAFRCEDVHRFILADG